MKVLHERGFVHGDIRPSNLVRLSGALRFIDFGRTRRATPHERAKEEKAVLAELDMREGGRG